MCSRGTSGCGPARCGSRPPRRSSRQPALTTSSSNTLLGAEPPQTHPYYAPSLLDGERDVCGLGRHVVGAIPEQPADGSTGNEAELLHPRRREGQPHVVEVV